MHSLIFDQVSFGYSDEILSDVSFTCSPGWTALVGGNGAGKVTNLPAKANTTPLHGKTQFHDSATPRRFGGNMGGNSSPRFSTQSRSSFGSMGHGGGFRR